MNNIFEKIKLCWKSLPFTSLVGCGVNSDINNKLSKIAREDTVFNLKFMSGYDQI